jgi:hypothetical protein
MYIFFLIHLVCSCCAVGIGAQQKNPEALLLATTLVWQAVDSFSFVASLVWGFLYFTCRV